MGLKKKKEIDITSPVDSTNNNPARDLFLILLVVATWPFKLIGSVFKRGKKNIIVIVILLCAVLYGLFEVSRMNINKRDIKTRIIQQTLEELTPEEKQELREEVSSLRESAGEDVIPVPLHPLLDVPIDMLSINYLLFMIKSGYVQPNGAGSEFILDSYLNSKHNALKKAAWEALQNIKTPDSERVRRNYMANVERQNEEIKRKYGPGPAPETGLVDGLKTDIQNKIIDHKNKNRK